MPTIRYAARPVEQRRDREVAATSVGAWSTSVTATFETDPEVVAAVLPPPLEPGEVPVVKVGISRVDLGRGLPSFGAGTFAVAARHAGNDGFYPLVMPMSTEQSVIGGRETFGEPKKLAQITLDLDGDALAASVTRMGTTIIEVTGDLGAELPVPPAEERLDFYFKFLRAPDGDGFDDDPWLVYCTRHTETRAHRMVDGTLVLRDSRFDPVADLPVRGPVTITLSERRTRQTGRLVERVPAADLAPFAHQRYDDLSPLGKDD
ncbi:MAG: acetoacetate decarboxylase family protein [Acidimicrobiales bacterium]|jgi:acetoacetate decarboxylase|nr:acetoacetate decarboxylase family protein [Acidimicrobiales bacterium]